MCETNWKISKSERSTMVDSAIFLGCPLQRTIWWKIQDFVESRLIKRSFGSARTNSSIRPWCDQLCRCCATAVPLLCRTKQAKNYLCLKSHLTSSATEIILWHHKSKSRSCPAASLLCHSDGNPGSWRQQCKSSVPSAIKDLLSFSGNPVAELKGVMSCVYIWKVRTHKYFVSAWPLLTSQSSKIMTSTQFDNLPYLWKRNALASTRWENHTPKCFNACVFPIAQTQPQSFLDTGSGKLLLVPVDKTFI